MDDYQQLDAEGQPKRVPAWFGVFAHAVLNEREIRVFEYAGGSPEIDAMFRQIGPILRRVPFKAHSVIRIV